MTHQHEWRNWPYSNDQVCLGCGYMIVGDLHFPKGKWTDPPIAVSPNRLKCGHAAFRLTNDGFKCRDCGSPADAGNGSVTKTD